MISDGTPFTRTSCFVVVNVVLVSPWRLFDLRFTRWLDIRFRPVYKLDYHGPEEGEVHDHH